MDVMEFPHTVKTQKPVLSALIQSVSIFKSQYIDL